VSASTVAAAYDRLLALVLFEACEIAGYMEKTVARQ